MTDAEFDAVLIKSAFAIAARSGWSRVSVALAAQEAGLALDQARHRFASACTILKRFGQLADAHALHDVPQSGSVRDRLFDVIMRRIDFLQAHRAGVLALLHGLPGDPSAAAVLAKGAPRSMAWLLGAAGVPTYGVRGILAANGLLAVWLVTLRAWEKDETADLSTTMAALDRALERAERLANWVNGKAPGESVPKPFPEPPPMPPAAGESADA